MQMVDQTVPERFQAIHARNNLERVGQRCKPNVRENGSKIALQTDAHSPFTRGEQRYARPQATQRSDY
jgi:hypothetical protein